MDDDIRTWKTSELLGLLFSLEAQKQAIDGLFAAGKSVTEIKQEMAEAIVAAYHEIDRRFPVEIPIVYGQPPLDR